MKGTVKFINEQRGMVAVLTEDGDYSIFELVSGDSVEVGDQVRWEDDTALGHEVLSNLSQRSKFEVYSQNHHVSQAILRQQLLL